MATAALKLRGLVAPVFTPMRADSSLDLGRVEAQAEYLAAQRVVGVFVAGTTGEGLSLSVTERQQLVERWCAVAGKKWPVIVHVGHNSLPDAGELAAHAQKAGASAIAAVPPFYYTPGNLFDVAACCAQVAAAAPRLPFYYYHIPGNTGVRVDVARLMEELARRVPSLAGLKFSDSDLPGFAQTVDRFGDDYDCFFGCDELLLPALSVGARAAIGSTYNFAAGLYHRMIDAFGRGDLETARRLNRDAWTLAHAIQCLGGVPALKAAMGLFDLDCGPCRLPLRTLREQQVEALRLALEPVVPFMRPGGSPAR